MGQAAKYALLGAAVATLLVTVVSIIGQFAGSGIISSISSGISTGVNAVSSFLLNARNFINYFLGGYNAARAFSVILWLNILFPVASFGYKISITIFRWMNQ